MAKSPEKLEPAAIEKRFTNALARALNTPHKPHKPLKAKVAGAKPKAKQSNKNR